MAYKYSSRNGRRIRLAAIHTAQGARNAMSLGSYFFQPTTQASSHVGIDAFRMLRYLPDTVAAWTLRSGNPISVNAEMCAFAEWTRAEWLSTGMVDGCANPRAILTRGAAWARQMCLTHGLPMNWLTPDEVRAGRAGIIHHYAWTIGMRDGTHTDVGKYFPVDVFMDLVRAKPAQQPPQPKLDPEDDMTIRYMRGDSTVKDSKGVPYGYRVFMVEYGGPWGDFAVRTYVDSQNNPAFLLAQKTFAGVNPETRQAWIVEQARLDKIPDKSRVMAALRQQQNAEIVALLTREAS